MRTKDDISLCPGVPGHSECSVCLRRTDADRDILHFWVSPAIFGNGYCINKIRALGRRSRTKARKIYDNQIKRMENLSNGD